MNAFLCAANKHFAVDCVICCIFEKIKKKNIFLSSFFHCSRRRSLRSHCHFLDRIGDNWNWCLWILLVISWMLLHVCNLLWWLLTSVPFKCDSFISFFVYFFFLIQWHLILLSICLNFHNKLSIFFFFLISGDYSWHAKTATRFSYEFWGNTSANSYR